MSPCVHCKAQDVNALLGYIDPNLLTYRSRRRGPQINSVPFPSIFPWVYGFAKRNGKFAGLDF